MDDGEPKPALTFRIETAGRASRATLVAAFGALLALALLPAVAGRNIIQDLIFPFYMLALAQCWNLLAGYAGLISVGQQAFVGFGGYLLFALTLLGGINPLLAIPLAGLLSALFALPTAFIVFRLRGAYFAIGTWVVAEVYRLAFAQFKSLGGGTGTSLAPSVTSAVPGIEWVKAVLEVRTPAARDIISYWVALALMVGTLIFVYLMLRSRRGLALGAIRDHETAAAGLGVDIYRTKLAVYVATAGVTGRRTHLSAEGPHLTGRCLLGTRLDSLCDFHCRHRRYRNDGGSDRRHGHLLSDAAISRRLRRLVSHPSRDARDSRHAVCSEGPLGPDRGAP
jgi:branched-chain amino acid transport system permease protein